MPSRIEIIQDDILNLPVQAIVLPSLPSLQPETAEQQAVHAKAGPKLAQECAHLAPCPIGQARITRGYEIGANFIIHAVGPVWGGGENNEDEQLANCYNQILELIKSFEIASIAIPEISTGDKGFPPMRAAYIGMKELTVHLKENQDISRIILCCQDEAGIQTYEAAFDKCTI